MIRIGSNNSSPLKELLFQAVCHLEEVHQLVVVVQEDLKDSLLGKEETQQLFNNRKHSNKIHKKRYKLIPSLRQLKQKLKKP